MAPDFDHEFAALRALSARVGADPALVQAAGGNTSLKADGILWIKASGTWLMHAARDDIFVPVTIAPLLAAVASHSPDAEKAHVFVPADRNPAGLRPSIETTVHALMPQTVVVHVHCVETIAAAVAIDAETALAAPLAGLNWTFIPYRRPGLPLALAIAERLTPGTDVLILGNHGLVVAAPTVAAAETLLADVCARLRRTPRPAPPPDLERLARLAGPGYRLPADPAAHATATDPTSCAIAATGSLYPDHVIFLGPGAAIARPGETADQASARLGTSPALLLVPGAGVLLAAQATPSADAMARCLADITARIPEGTALNTLTDADHGALLNWDAEKYRQALSRQAAS